MHINGRNILDLPQFCNLCTEHYLFKDSCYPMIIISQLLENYDLKTKTTRNNGFYQKIKERI